MSFKYFIIIFLSILLSACGGGGGKEPKIPAPETPTENSGLAPADIYRTIFDMTIDSLPAEGLGDNFPLIGNKIIQEYIHDNLFYLNSDQYVGWQYRGEFVYQKNEDEADVSLTFSSTNTAYNIHYQFTDVSSGSWRGTFNNGSSELSGTFTTTPFQWVEQLEFLGTIVDEQDIISNITNVTYQYKVYLPIGYSDTNKNYPVVYVTDAQMVIDERFAHNVQTLQKDIIVVGITEGPKNRRSTDYIYPGSSQYLDFLALELLPLVESTYRIDSNHRTLFGYSLGGMLIRHALLNEVYTPLFQNFIASDGAFGYEDTVYRELEKDAYSANSLANRKLYLSGATGYQGFGYDVGIFNETIRSYGLEDFTVVHQSFDLTHNQIVLPTGRDALEILFP